MNRPVAAALLLAACAATTALAQAPAATTPPPAAAPVKTGPGPAPGWTTVGNGTWAMQRNEIVGTGADGNSLLATEKSYTDAHVTLEFQVSNPGNSGVFFRCESMTGASDTACYEINIYDDRPDQTGRTGAVVNVAPPKVKINAMDGKWHTYDITIQGDHLVVRLDGKLTADVHDSRHTKPSPIGIQNGAGAASWVRVRNVKITPL